MVCIDVNITADTILEGKEQFTIQLTTAMPQRVVINVSTVSVWILPPPNITLGPSDTLVSMGDSLTLNCVSTNIGSIQITWTGPNGDLSGEQVVGSDSVSSTLTLTEVDSNDGGEYTCVASNEAGVDSAVGVVYVRPVVSPTIGAASLGDMVDFVCVVQNNPPANISWERMDDSGVFMSLMGETERTLNFDLIAYSDSGFYRCVVNTALFGVLESPAAVLAGE